MGIREKLNNKPGIAIGVGAALLVLSMVFITMQLTSGGGASSEEAYYTIDDGATWFPDDANKPTPFQHDGKEAVRAYVYECKGKEFVNHLERFTPERRKVAEAAAEAEKTGKPPPPAPAAAGNTVMWGQEIKKPGDKAWTPAGNLAKAGPMAQPKCPEGTGEVVPVVP